MKMKVTVVTTVTIMRSKMMLKKKAATRNRY